MARKDKVRRSCRCGNSCLGPLTFHSEAKGQHVKLSAGARRATRNPHSFHHGVMFSSRPLRLDEKVRMRVERCVPAWHGALRLGFTSVPPGTGPVCSFAIPDLTERQGFWATPVPESHCSPRTELTFWLTGSGHLRIRTNSGYEHEEKLDQIDTRKPIWAMIDVYGQTTAVLLLGSEKKGLLSTRRSCPAPIITATEENCGYDEIPEQILKKMMHRKSVDLNRPLYQTKADDEEFCVVCFSETDTVRLDCGHSCLCPQCAARVITEFGTCPLCRERICR
ncbi:E3 ubiquitin-protein ligase NEURL3 isoform 2-T2 [Clarias gariepinus]|uniref:E3 ubiquitin-protein ligase NEURL3-like isoform X2 n=1 Tax=Clarias gariepinus TaxID=13013 RepID=UPI00234C0412|nr:E3 ubiquitin-protein ligase NEURL3-like isoform X2 [Clarias gariepinus]